MHRNPRFWLLQLACLTLVTSIAFGQQAPSAPLKLKGPTMGSVTFSHHVSKPEKPLKSPQEVCTDCHTKPPTPPVKTGLPAAFHNSAATAGLCITCHKTENARGKAAPLKCAECHKKEDVQ